MLRLLKFLFTGDWHLHVWQTVDVSPCSDDDGRRWNRYYCRCKHCGTVRKFD